MRARVREGEPTLVYNDTCARAYGRENLPACSCLAFAPLPKGARHHTATAGGTTTSCHVTYLMRPVPEVGPAAVLAPDGDLLRLGRGLLGIGEMRYVLGVAYWVGGSGRTLICTYIYIIYVT